MSGIPILQFVEPENINRYQVELQDSLCQKNSEILSKAYVLCVNNEYGGMVCKYIASQGYKSVLDKLDLMQSQGRYPYYILLPEFLGAGICWLEWWQPALSRNELDSMIQENTMSEDFDGLRSWVEQLIKRDTKV